MSVIKRAWSKSIIALLLMGLLMGLFMGALVCVELMSFELMGSTVQDGLIKTASATPLTKSNATLAEVSVHKSAHLTHEDARLGELASLKGFEPRVRAKLAQLVLFRAPEAGTSLSLKREALNKRLSEALQAPLEGLGLSLEQVRLSLPKRLSVDRAATTLSPSALSRYLEDAALAFGPLEGLQIAHIKPPRVSALKVPEGATLTFSVSTATSPTRIPVDLMLTQQGRLVRRQRLFVEVDHLQDVVVLTHQLAAGATLSASDLTLAPISASKLPPNTLTDTDELVGAKLRQSVGAKIPLRKAWLWVPPLIKRGSQVLMLFKRGSLTISAQGEALGDGAKGDMIRVKNIQSKKIVMGRAVAPNQVEVEF